jgi:rhamnose utilization protein RhaD (predicted bifunctional aldolase and dehydrogenase)
LAALPPDGAPDVSATESTHTPREVQELLDRSNRLGADPSVTNYGGGNTSAKVTVTSPATGRPEQLLYV